MNIQNTETGFAESCRRASDAFARAEIKRSSAQDIISQADGITEADTEEKQLQANKNISKVLEELK